MSITKSVNTFSLRNLSMRELEALFLRIYRPPGNSQKGRFVGNLHAELSRRMKEIDEENRERLIGRRRRKQAGGRANQAGGRARR